ncbi:pentapeptide repeat-containing protein, partial [Lysobacter sp. A378]
LRSARLRSARLRSARLRSARLRSARLRSARLRSARLRSARLRPAPARRFRYQSAWPRQPPRHRRHPHRGSDQPSISRWWQLPAVGRRCRPVAPMPAHWAGCRAMLASARPHRRTPAPAAAPIAVRQACWRRRSQPRQSPRHPRRWPAIRWPTVAGHRPLPAW